MKIENICINCMKEKNSHGTKCEYCGFDLTTAVIPAHHLKPFSILAGKYLVGRAIGEGGFGITYIGMDLNLEMRVAIKEYYPNGSAVRDINGEGATVQSQSRESRALYESGREKFINEAKTLAKCVDFPEIVTVKDFFKENNTAYIVMEYIDGKTLRTYLNEKGGRISVNETINMMKPLICSLGKVHKMNLIHRDISPDNIMICKDGSIKILDFGGARDFVANGDKSLSVMMKPGYTPEEQYRTGKEQGPWTDVYALCATMYRCITGQIPQAAWERVSKDNLKSITELQPNCLGEMAYVIQKGLSVYKKDRWQSMEELYDNLYKEDVVEEVEKEEYKENIDHKENKDYKEYKEKRQERKQNDHFVFGVIGGVLITLLVAIGGNFIYKKVSDFTPKTQEEKSGEEQPQTTPTPNVTQEGTVSPSPRENVVTDIKSQVGYSISDDEIENIDKYFTSSKIKRGDEIFNRIDGKSYRDNDDISLEDLRYMTIPYYNFDQQVMLGEMIVNVEIQNDVRSIFGELFNNKYEINSMRLIDDYWEEGTNAYIANNNSIEANNTSCFCYRKVIGSKSISNHGYGRAIDVNPQQNPYVKNGENIHRNADEYVNNRSVGEPHVIMGSDEDICYSTFTKYGFTWGGNWTNPIDYQHFEYSHQEGESLRESIKEQIKENKEQNKQQNKEQDEETYSKYLKYFLGN